MTGNRATSRPPSQSTAPMNLLQVEMNTGTGWVQSFADDVSAEKSLHEIEVEVRGYAIGTGHAHRAKLNGVVVAGYDPVARRTIGQVRA